MSEKALLSDERAEDVKDDLQVAPNFPGLRLKPRPPTRTRGESEVVTRDLVVRTYPAEKGAERKGVMVALRIPMSAAIRVALPGGEPPEDLHLTLAYLGDADELDPDRRRDLSDRVKAVAATTPPLAGTLAGYGRFSHDGEDVLWVGLDSPDLAALRHRVVQACRDALVPPAGDHGFTPHVTLAYVPEGEGEDSMPAPTEVAFKWLSLVVAGTESMMRLAGEARDLDAEPLETGGDARTWSMTERPAGGDLTSLPQLERWAEGRGDLVVRAVLDAQHCVVAKKGRDVSVSVAGWDWPAHLRDLAEAMARIPHDYVLVGWLAARGLGGDWLPREDLPLVLTAEVLASPVFMPRDLLALDGDLTDTPARERLELLRALVAPAGAHVVVPLQVECPADDDLEAAVDRAMAWRPFEGAGLAPAGVEAAQAASAYTHGPSAALARLVLRTGASKAWSDEARAAALEARRRNAAAIRPPSAERGEEGLGHTVVEAGGTRVFVDDREMPGGGPGRAANLEILHEDPEGNVAGADPVSTQRAMLGALQLIRDRGYTHLTAMPANPGVKRLMERLGARPLKGDPSYPQRLWLPLAFVRKEVGLGFGAGPGPTDVPEGERLDRLRHGAQAEPGFLTPERKDALVSGDLSAPGGGVLAPEQGAFGRPRRSRPVSKEFGDNVSAGVPLTLVPTRGPRGRRPEDDSGAPQWPHFGGERKAAWEESEHPRDDGGKFSESGGGTVFHGTSGRGTRFKPGVMYLAPSHREAALYATNDLLRTRGGVPRVWEIRAAPGRTRDVNREVLDALESGDVDETIAAEAARARADGYRYLSFEHPGAGDDYMTARVSLYPDKDLRIVRTRRPGDVPADLAKAAGWNEEDHPRDEGGEGGGQFVSGGGATAAGNPPLPGATRRPGEEGKAPLPPAEEPYRYRMVGEELQYEYEDPEGKTVWARNPEQPGDRRVRPDALAGATGHPPQEMGTDGAWHELETRVVDVPGGEAVEVRDRNFGDWEELGKVGTETMGADAEGDKLNFVLTRSGDYQLAESQPGDERVGSGGHLERMNDRGEWEQQTRTPTESEEPDEEDEEQEEFPPPDSADADPEAGTEDDDEHQLRLLRAGVTRFRGLGGGVNKSYVAELDDGTQAVWKAGPGKNVHDLDGPDYAREQAAYDLARMAGYGDLVPPTVVREVDGVAGSLQAWAEENYTKAGASKRSRERALAFDYAIGNLDRHNANWLQNGGKVWLIDNGLSMPDEGRTPHLRTAWGVDVGTPLPRHVERSWAPVLRDWERNRKVLARAGLTASALRGIEQRVHDLVAGAARPAADTPGARGSWAESLPNADF